MVDIKGQIKGFPIVFVGKLQKQEYGLIGFEIDPHTVVSKVLGLSHIDYFELPLRLHRQIYDQFVVG